MNQEYDVKYAIAALNKPGKVSFYPYEDRIVGYIITKVLVVREETKVSNGEEYSAYDVLLPYVDISNRREEPILDASGNPVNTSRIYKVYDSYEDAIKDRDELNKQLKFVVVAKELRKQKSNKKVDDVFFQYNAQMNECKIFESVIGNRCQDLKTKSRIKMLK